MMAWSLKDAEEVKEEPDERCHLLNKPAFAGSVGTVKVATEGASEDAGEMTTGDDGRGASCCGADLPEVAEEDCLPKNMLLS